MDIYNLQNEKCSIDGSLLVPVEVTYRATTGEWELMETYRVKVLCYDLTIPEGFRFDLATIPRLAWWAIAPFELSLVAPLVHDFLYHYQGKVPINSVNPAHIFTRQEADLIFKQLMKAEGVSTWRCSIAYWAVRTFAGQIWIKRLKNE